MIHAGRIGRLAVKYPRYGFEPASVREQFSSVGIESPENACRSGDRRLFFRRLRQNDRADSCCFRRGVRLPHKVIAIECYLPKIACNVFGVSPGGLDDVLQ